MKIAIVGTGIGGISAAYHLLEDGHEVILLEKEKRIGGHTYNIEINNEKIDLGFMMYGDSNPNIKKWFNHVLHITNSDGTTNHRIPMSMSVVSDVLNDNHMTFSSRSPFTTLSDLFNIKLWRIMIDIYYFTLELIKADTFVKKNDHLSTLEWSKLNKYSNDFFRFYFLPFVSILWTIPKKDVMNLPISQFLRCLRTHANSLYIPFWQVIMGMFKRRVDRPKHLWWYIGSKYHEPFLNKYFNFNNNNKQKKYNSKLICDANVISIENMLNNNNSNTKNDTNYKMKLTLSNNELIYCDHIVLACHPDECLNINGIGGQYAIKDNLIKYKFHNSMMYIHTDPSFLPKEKKKWGSWNVRITEKDEYILTYWINRIQKLKKQEKDIFVTITPYDINEKSPNETDIIMKFPWDHPKLLADCIPEEEILCQDGISLSGAWLGRGFHEDGFVAGRRAAYLISKLNKNNKNNEKEKNVYLYEDPGNIPIPKVPKFSVPLSFNVLMVSITVTSFIVYKMIEKTIR